MNHQPNAYFFKIEKISEDSLIFEQLQKEELFFSYFQVDQNSYLFFYGETNIDMDLIDPHIHILEELDRKQRKIRSLRGFFLYAQEIIGSKEDSQILETNLKPSFWRNLKNILRQNKKSLLIKFLFSTSELKVSNHSENQIENIKNFESTIKSLQDQIHSLQERVTILESRRNLNVLSDVSNIDEKVRSNPEPGDISLKEYSTVLDISNTSLQEYQKPIESNITSETPKMTVEALTTNEQYNLASTQEIYPDEPNFITLATISEEDKLGIIKNGFQLYQEGKISLKKYYESRQEYSLFQFKGYNIKYEAIRKNKLYKQLK